MVSRDAKWNARPNWEPRPEQVRKATEYEPFEGDDELVVKSDDESRASSPPVTLEQLRSHREVAFMDPPLRVQPRPFLPARYGDTENWSFRRQQPETHGGVWLMNQRTFVMSARYRNLDGLPTKQSSSGMLYYWPQDERHRSLFGQISIHVLGGRAQELLHRWDFSFSGLWHLRNLLHQSCMSQHVWVEVEAVLKAKFDAKETVCPSIYVEAGGSGHAGFYAHKIMTSPRGGLALAIQLLGSV